MFTALLKISMICLLYVVLTCGIWTVVEKRRETWSQTVLIGIVFGIFSILSTHFSVDYGLMVLNLRDLGPLSAGLFFHPVSGLIAGFIGGVERFIAGEFFGVGSYTRLACSLSTCLAGLLSFFLGKYFFRRVRPVPFYSFFIGSVMEVFHMYVVLLTHRSDTAMALEIVKKTAFFMILFTGLGLCLSSVVLQIRAGDYRGILWRKKDEKRLISEHFQSLLFFVTLCLMVLTFFLTFGIQSQYAIQTADKTLEREAVLLKQLYDESRSRNFRQEDFLEQYNRILSKARIGLISDVFLLDSSGRILAGGTYGTEPDADLSAMEENEEASFTFIARVKGRRSLLRVERLHNGKALVLTESLENIFWNRDAIAYETAMADILLFAVIYMLISYMVDAIVVTNLNKVVASLRRIANGNLNEVISVRTSAEFSSLSDDINSTVDTLKSYIDESRRQMEKELLLAKTIQSSTLPQNFSFNGHSEFELFASMDPAREVGGDFYDFFFTADHHLALVIADVSGKGVPGALFMMRSKTTIRQSMEPGLSLAEILQKANHTLCEGNEAEMFVTAWIGIIDLKSGIMKCANAGHEYPILLRAGGDYELLRDEHSMPLAAIEGTRFREYTLSLHPGDRLFLYTDGIPEAINEQTEQYGTDRLLTCLNICRDMSAAETLPAVRENLRRFTGKAEQFDDITMLTFFYHPDHPESPAARQEEEERL